MKVTERRCDYRFTFRLPLIVKWMKDAELCEVITETQDVSSRGIYFWLPETVKKGTTIEIVLMIPTEIRGATSQRIRHVARIQRCDFLESGKSGVAVNIEQLEFLPNPQEIPS
jgi:PilZ domain